MEMTHTKNQFLACMIFGVSGIIMPNPAFSADITTASVAQRGDPERWYQEEMTPLAYFKTLKKEAQAVYQLSVIACKQVERIQQNGCLRDAKETMRQDLENAYKQSGIPVR